MPHFKATAAAAAAIGVVVLVSPAFAHHVMGGELPGTAWHGLLSGLGHPIIGIDHFAFIVGVGLASHLAGQIALLPLLFVAGTALGCLTHVEGYDLPFSELSIALTIAIAAVIVGTRAKVPTGVLATVFLVAGALHGYAYGESIVGAEPAPLTAYITGFGLVQYGLAVGSGAALRGIVRRGYLSETVAMRMAGGAIALVACLALVRVAVAG